MATTGRYDHRQHGHQSWIPTHVPNDAACRSDEKNRVGQDGEREYRMIRHVSDVKKKLHPTFDTTSHHHQLVRPKSRNQRPFNYTSRRRLHPSNNWVGSGIVAGGMRAIFLHSGQNSSTGTGVFLPRNSSSTHTSPPSSPVLLPARVVQALNLNVNGLGLQLTRRQLGQPADATKGSKPGPASATPPARNNTSSVEPHNENASPEVFLPKEWTY